MTKTQNAERAEAVTKLREWIKPGDTVYTILRHVSRSGMRREIGVVLLKDDHDRGNATHQGIADLHPNYLVAKALGDRIGKNDGIITDGCGMDMGFHLVYNLSRTMFPDGFDCIGDHCPSNDHSNRENNAHHSDGGYALRHRWL